MIKNKIFIIVSILVGNTNKNLFTGLLFNQFLLKVYLNIHYFKANFEYN